MLQIKRAYEAPKGGDGRRFLVERLWPRGVKKEVLKLDAWLKDVAPSPGLRTWFGHRLERWEEFRRRYRAELSANREGWQPIIQAAADGPVTLVYAARDTEHNGALVLRDFIAERQRRPSAPDPVRAPARRSRLARDRRAPGADRRSRAP